MSASKSRLEKLLALLEGKTRVQVERHAFRQQISRRKQNLNKNFGMQMGRRARSGQPQQAKL
jgi:hypothetical protein